jgi:hypothetical protein
MKIMTYPSVKRFESSNKLFMNYAIKQIVKKYGIKTKLATVLDDHHLQSTKTCKPFQKIIVTQNDFNTYNNIQNQHLHKNTVCMLKDYSEIEEKGINLDHADFCNTWESNRDSVFKRLRNKQYANKSILRLTVCIRGMTNKFGRRKGMTLDKCIDKITNELEENAYGYSITPLPIKSWGMPLRTNGFDTTDKECIAYTYGTMINMIFLLECN